MRVTTSPRKQNAADTSAVSDESSADAGDVPSTTCDIASTTSESGVVPCITTISSATATAAFDATTAAATIPAPAVVSSPAAAPRDPRPFASIRIALRLIRSAVVSRSLCVVKSHGASSATSAGSKSAATCTASHGSYRTASISSISFCTSDAIGEAERESSTFRDPRAVADPIDTFSLVSPILHSRIPGVSRDAELTMHSTRPSVITASRKIAPNRHWLLQPAPFTGTQAAGCHAPTALHAPSAISAASCDFVSSGTLILNEVVRADVPAPCKVARAREESMPPIREEATLPASAMCSGSKAE
eukprot:6079500-Pleurochrysis_carterae.AAC.1